MTEKPEEDDDERELPRLSFGQLTASLWRVIAPYRSHVTLIALCLAIEMTYTSAVPFSFSLLVDIAIGQHRKNVLIAILVSLAVGAVLATLAGVYRDRLDAELDAAVLTDLRRRIAEHIQKLSISFHSRSQVGDLLARFSSDLAEVESALNELIPWAVLPALDVCLSASLLFVLQPKLALFAMAVFPMCLLGPAVVGPRATRASSVRQDDEAAVLSTLAETFSGHQVAKAFGLDEHLLAQLGDKLEALRRSSMRVVFLGLFAERTANIGILVLDLSLLGAGSWLCFEGRMSIGTLASFQVLFGNLAYSLSYVTQYFPSVVSAAGGMARVEEILAEQPAVFDDPMALPVPRLEKELVFENVSFRYDPAHVSLDSVSLTIPAGGTVAIVGPTGAGKSTALALLLRFYDPTAGRITLDGHDLRHVTQKSIRAQIGVVFQETFLFNTTIRESIRAGQLDASDSEVEEAARAAEIHEAIVKMPRGYDTRVGERGARLSGGQRQRIGIARALLRDPAILLLDEATSALDPATDAAIRATLARVSRGRTVITVTHRIATAAASSRIFVLDHGKLVEQGVHAELIAANGVYRHLWDHQTSHGEAAGDTADQDDDQDDDEDDE